MKKVKEEATPLVYMKGEWLKSIDFSDTFSTTNQENNLEEITNLVFNNPPKWITQLFELRNTMVKWIGLTTALPADYNEEYAVGGYIGFFKIFAVSTHEIVLGANDSHLNFRAIISNNKEAAYNIKVITLVKYNNLKGKIYMNTIKPFHRLVVKRMVKNAYKSLQ